MAGRNPDFDARAFRDGIQFAMTMGLAPDEDERVTFFLPATLMMTASADGEGTPFDPDATVRSVRPPGIRVPCAVEYYDEQGELLAGFGVVSASRLKLTLLDEDWAKVRNFEYVVAGGDKYVRRRVQPPSGLFDVGLYEVWCHSENEV